MLSDSDSHEIQPQKGLQIKQDNKFFSRLMSKETSMDNSSSMVYYGGASGAIPFMWESHPGTPKHPSSDTTLPPLTPPPSYHSSIKSKSKSMQKKGLKSTILGSIFRKLISTAPRKNHASPSSRLSLHGSGSYSSSANYFMNRKLFHRRRGYFSCSCSCSRSSVHNCMDYDDDGEERLGSSTSTFCFGVKVKPRNLNEFRGCQSMVKMKKALLTFVSQG